MSSPPCNGSSAPRPSPAAQQHQISDYTHDRRRSGAGADIAASGAAPAPSIAAAMTAACADQTACPAHRASVDEDADNQPVSWQLRLGRQRVRPWKLGIAFSSAFSESPGRASCASAAAASIHHRQYRRRAWQPPCAAADVAPSRPWQHQQQRSRSASVSSWHTPEAPACSQLQRQHPHAPRGESPQPHATARCCAGVISRISGIDADVVPSVDAADRHCLGRRFDHGRTTISSPAQTYGTRWRTHRDFNIHYLLSCR